MNTTSLQDLWATRPLRRRSEGKVAGVCAGMGARYNVDPTLIRVAFVVATIFGGSGILLYIVAALVMPGGKRAGKADAGLSTGKLILLGIIAVILVSSMGRDAWWGSGGLLGAVLMLGGWWLLYQRTPLPPAGTAVSQGPVPAAPHAETMPYPVIVPPVNVPSGNVPQANVPHSEAPAPYTVGTAVPPVAGAPNSSVETTPHSMVEPGASEASAGVETTPSSIVEPGANEASAGVETTPGSLGEPGANEVSAPPSMVEPGANEVSAGVETIDPLLQRPTPPSWDPLGVADFAWDLPEPPPSTESETPKPPRSAVLPITAGLAVLTAMAGTAAQLLGAEWFTVARIASLSLLVIGAGLIVTGLQRKPEGGHASGLVPLGALVGAIAVVATMVASSGWSAPRGGIGERPYEITEQSQLQSTYELSVGKTILDLRSLPALDADKKVTIRQGIGEIQVLLPPDVRVQPACGVGIGDYVCPLGVVGPAEGPVLTIDAHVGVGNVEMKK